MLERIKMRLDAVYAKGEDGEFHLAAYAEPGPEATRIVYCKECRLAPKCPNQKKKDERDGNLFKEVVGCNEGIHTIIQDAEE